jgi:hypothetical protein
MDLDLPDGRKISLVPRGVQVPKEEGTKRNRRKKADDFAAEQPWLAPYLANGLVEVRDEQGRIKQALQGVQCQAGKVIQYTSQYQELDKTHLERSYEPTRELRSADFTHLKPCGNVLGSGGFLRTSDFHQTLLCNRCQDLAKRHRNAIVKAAVREIAIQRAREG